MCLYTEKIIMESENSVVVIRGVFRYLFKEGATNYKTQTGGVLRPSHPTVSMPRQIYNNINKQLVHIGQVFLPEKWFTIKKNTIANTLAPSLQF